MKAQVRDRMKEQLTFQVAIETYTKGKRHRHNNIKKTLICLRSWNGFKVKYEFITFPRM